MVLDRLVLGTAALGGLWGPVDPEESVKTILEALEAGMPAIDTAPAYGDAESFLGAALRLWNGNRPKISSKVGRLRGRSITDGNYDYSDDGMLRSVENTLKRLGIDKLDMLFLHDPLHMNPEDAERVLARMVFFREKGYAQNIGLGGNPPAWFMKYLETGEFDALMGFNKLNACTIEATEQDLLFCTQHGIRYFAASPLYMGLLGSQYHAFKKDRPVWISVEVMSKAGYLESLARTNHISLPELAHRFLLSLPFNFQIVIGASTSPQLKESIGHFSKGCLPAALQDEVMRCSINKL